MNELERVAHKFDPQATLLAAWELKGGVSAQMTALEMALPDGQRRKMIVRRPGARALQLNPHAAGDEYRILQIVQTIGVKTQTPYLLDESGEIYAQPYLVIEYIEGEPLYAPPDVIAFVEQIAAQLATLHRLDSSKIDLTFLPKQEARLGKMLSRRPTRLDDSLQEGQLRALLEAVWPLPMPQERGLVHGDFWPGNLLWNEGALAAVIDWEDAEVGNPLFDFAVSRLDTLWIFGVEAMEAFTRRYQQLAGFPRQTYAQLPYWDLVAALRPASRIEEFAAGWPQLGRSDITAESIRAGHRWFVAQALAQLT